MFGEKRRQQGKLSLQVPGQVPEITMVPRPLAEKSCVM